LETGKDCWSLESAYLRLNPVILQDNLTGPILKGLDFQVRKRRDDTLLHIRLKGVLPDLIQNPQPTLQMPKSLIILTPQ
jgi:hypothetical protein